MIRFTIGRGAQRVEGQYTPQEGFIITTQRPALGGLAVTLQAQLENEARRAGLGVISAYALAVRVLKEWGASVDTSDMPKPDPDRDY